MTRDIPDDLDHYNALAEMYEAHRPRPPAIIPDMLTQAILLGWTCRARGGVAQSFDA